MFATRPDCNVSFSHVTDEIYTRVVDLRTNDRIKQLKDDGIKNRIFITDAVQMDISSSKIRRNIRKEKEGWENFTPEEVGKIH